MHVSVCTKQKTKTITYLANDFECIAPVKKPKRTVCVHTNDQLKCATEQGRMKERYRQTDRQTDRDRERDREKEKERKRKRESKRE